jgi:iron(III) transport system substrate-binding protein
LRPRTHLVAAPIVTAALLLGACSSGASPTASAGRSAPASSAAASEPQSSQSTGTLTIYSGRSEELIGPLVEQFTEATGIEARVDYGGTTEMAAAILEEGANSPADVFFGQDAGALGALAEAGMLAELPGDLLDLVDARFRSPDGLWVGASGRARVVAYNPERVDPSQLPDSIHGFTDPSWGGGRIGWVPTNASFQAFVTALRVLEGDEPALDWVRAINANEPRVYEGNGGALEAVAAGEVDVAFINHYYLEGQLAENPDFNAVNYFLPGGDPGALVNVAGGGILASSANADAALAFMEFLLSEQAQTYFAEETFEYPLVTGIPASETLPSLEEIEAPDIDLSDLADLEGTLELLQEAGVL